MEKAKVTTQQYKLNFDDYCDIFTHSLSGIAGGAVLGLDFGMIGSLIGALFGACVTVYSKYKGIIEEKTSLNDSDIIIIITK